MRKLRILIPVIVILGVAALLRPMAAYRMFHWNRRAVIQEVFRGRKTFNVMVLSPQVTAQRLHLKSGDAGPVGHASELLDAYTMDTPVALTADQAQTIKGLLQRPSSYFWDVRSCMPNYGVIYNFQSGDHTIRIAFCFKCNIVGVFDGNSGGLNKINFTSQFNPIRGQMVALSKTLFPGDKEIQALQ